MIYPIPAVVTSCTAWLPDCYRKTPLFHSNLKSFCWISTLLKRNRISCRYCLTRIGRLLAARPQYVTRSSGDALLCVSKELQVVLLIPALSNEAIPRAHTHSKAPIGLKQQHVPHCIQKHYCHVISIIRRVPNSSPVIARCIIELPFFPRNSKISPVSAVLLNSFSL